VASPKSHTFELLVLLYKRPLVVWASMASPRPERSLAYRSSYDCCESLTGRCRQNAPSGFLIYQGAVHDIKNRVGNDGHCRESGRSLSDH